MNNKFTLSPIGHVKAEKGGFSLVINKDYIPALRELEGFSHVNVLWWAHKFDEENYRKILVCEKPYKKSPEKMGVFATRSPIRPNPLALTPVAVIKIDHNKGKIQIPYIDAEEDTPIIDLKPYHPSSDRIEQVSLPKWCSHWPKCYEDSADFDWESEFVDAR